MAVFEKGVMRRGGVHEKRRRRRISKRDLFENRIFSHQPLVPLRVVLIKSIQELGMRIQRVPPSTPPYQPNLKLYLLSLCEFKKKKKEV